MMAVASSAIGVRLGAIWPATAPALPVTLADRVVLDLVQDSRRVTPGAVLVALRGGRAHGLEYAQDALDRGAIAVLWDEAAAAPLEDPALLRVPGLRTHLPALAHGLFGAWPETAPVIAVTGTDGKTTVTHLVAQALEALGTTSGLVGTLGAGHPGALTDCGHTTPGTLDLHRHLGLLAAAGCQAVALEASSHGLAQGRLDGVPIRMAVLTQVGSDHLDYHVDQMDYVAAKARLFAWPGLRDAVVNVDDTSARAWLEQDQVRADRIWRYSALGAPADLAAREVQATPDGLRFTLVTAAGEWPVESPLLGRFQVSNLLATLAVLHGLGHSWDTAVQAVSGLAGAPGRMERFPLRGGALAVVDYAHTEQALAAALDALRLHTRGRLIVVFGCGGERDTGKRAAMGRAACRRADAVIVTDDNPRHEEAAAIRAAVLAGCERPEISREIGDRAQAIRTAVVEATAEDIVLVAGKGHETTQQIGDQYHPFSDREQLLAWSGGAGRQGE